MAEDFSTGAELTIGIDDRSLSAARNEIEQALGGTPVGVEAALESGGGGQLDSLLDSSEGQQTNIAIMTELAEERNDILEDIRDGAGGGGGIGSLLGGSRGGGAASAAGGSFAGGTITNFFSSVGAGTAAQAGARAAPPLAIAAGGQQLFDWMDERFDVSGGLREVLGFERQDPIVDQIDFDSKIPELQWPEVGVQDMLMPIENNVNKLSWDLPNKKEVLTPISDSIDSLNWEVPTADSVLGPIDDNIESPPWNVPGTDNVLEVIKDNVTGFQWNVPSAGDIAEAIADAATGGGGNNGMSGQSRAETGGGTRGGTQRNNFQIDINNNQQDDVDELRRWVESKFREIERGVR